MTHDTLLNAAQQWQRGAGTRDALVAHLTALGREDAPVITDLIQHLRAHAGHDQDGDAPRSTDGWRDELMGSRACTWGGAGMLVGPNVLILTDGQRGVVLGERDTRALSSSVSGSLMLLCQTIVMAEHALNQREMQDLREQRLQSASTSLSEIDPIR